MGWDTFAEKYLTDGVNGYTNTPFEKQAFAEFELAQQECLHQPAVLPVGVHVDVDRVSPPSQPSRPAEPGVDPRRGEHDRTGRGGRTLTP